ncbi:MAG: T9SS type A sorting domain-containing protein [Sphingobacteriales bacterium]|nr:MAG: T9SS type A sorting domain-containing protein [Sphingobacteriales bacterium]
MCNTCCVSAHLIFVFMRNLHLSLFLFLLFSCIIAKAQPPQFAYTGPNATTSNAIPLGTGTSWDEYRSQWIYLPGDLGASLYPGLITKIYFRVGSATTTTSHIFNNFEVNLGQSSVTNLNTAYQTGLTNVYPAGTFTVTGPLAIDQWIPITLATPYFYDPANTLIVEIKHGIKTSGGFSLRSGGAPLNPAYSTVHTQRYGKIATSPNGTSRQYTYQFGIDVIPADRPDNAGLGNLIAPVTFCSDPQDIKLQLKNNGTNLINTVQIDWLFDGVPQTPFTYSGTPIPSLLGPGSNTVTATIGTGIVFGNAPHTVKAWTTLPNGNADTVNTDDTMTYVIQKSLGGDYTVGGTNPDFVDVKEAVDALNRAGICNPVNFIIRDGTYTDAGVIRGPIAGSSLTNRVTFRSQSGVAANVIINGANATSVFGMDNVSNVTIKNVSIIPIASTAITLSGTTARDSFVGCIFTAPVTTSTTSSQGLISCVSSSSYAGDSNVFIKNKFENAATGLYLYSSTSRPSRDNVIDSNTFTGQNYTSAYLYYMDGTKVRGNTVNMSPSSYGYGMYVYHHSNNGNNRVEITDNEINNSPATYGYSGYFAYIVGTSTNRAVIARNKLNTNTGTYFYNYLAYYSDFVDIYNNEIVSNGTYGYVYFYYSDAINFYNNTVSLNTTTSSSTTYGLYYYNTNASKVYNNTFNIIGTSPTAYGCYFYASGTTYNDNMIRNNVFSSTGSDGVGMYWSNSGTNNTSDYNNIYASSGNHFSDAGTAQSSLHQWRLTKGLEKNSITYDPGLVGSGDVHPNPAKDASWSLNGRGIHMPGNDIDRDGNPRETNAAAGVPDIGAYEFEPTTIPPLAVAEPTTIAAGATQVFTFGQDTVATLAWAPNSVVSNTIEVRQYSGHKGPSYPAGTNNMYFYTDLLTQNVTADYKADVYYHDNWLGNISAETDLRVFKKLNPNPWVAYNENLSGVDVNRNIISATDVTSTGLFTGVENGAIFSAVVVQVGQTTFCPGGDVELHAKTNGPGYTYQWYRFGVAISGATDSVYSTSTDGDYSVTITRNTGSGTETATSGIVGLTKIPAPNATITADGPLVYCTGGARTLIATPGSGLRYQWQLDGLDIPGANNDSFSVNTGGNYTVAVSNIGCSVISPVTTISVGPLNVDLGRDTSFCESKPLVLDAGYPGARYTWSTGDTTQKITITDRSGEYSVVVDGGTNCKDADTVNVLIDPLPSVVGISYIRVNTSTFQFSPSGQQDVNTYAWVFGDGSVDMAVSPTHTYDASEPWEVTLIVANDCGFDTTELDLRSLSVKDVNDVSDKVTLYPNPAHDVITLATANNIRLSKIMIVNNIGQTVLSLDGGSKSLSTFDVSSLPTGNYLLKAILNDNKQIVKKFTITR